jgi:hypothetical protein
VSVDSAAVLAADEVLEADAEVELAVELLDAVLAPELQPASVVLTSRAATPVAGISRDFLIAVLPLSKGNELDLAPPAHLKSRGNLMPCQRLRCRPGHRNPPAYSVDSQRSSSV